MNLLVSPRPWMVLAALFGATGVAAGAYGWHGLEGDETVREIFRIGVQYQMWHAIALIGVAWRCTAGLKPARFAAAAGVLFSLGIVLFSGNIYAFALTGELPISGGAPAGGFCLIAGWVGLGISAFVGVENNTGN